MKANLIVHTKTYRLADKLNIPRCFAVGILASIWDFARRERKTGDLSGLTSTDIGRQLGLDDKESFHSASEVVEALVKTGWLDQDEQGAYRIHDWLDHCETYTHRDLKKVGYLPEGWKRGDSTPETLSDFAEQSLTDPDMMNNSPELCSAHGKGECIGRVVSCEGKSEGEVVGWSEFWAALWSRVKPDAVRREANAIICDTDTTWAELIDAAAEFTESPAGKAGKFTPNPDTWLRDGRYRDDRATWWTHDLKGEARVAAAKKYERRRKVNAHIARLSDDEWTEAVTNINARWANCFGTPHPNTPWCVGIGMPRERYESRAEVWKYLQDTTQEPTT